MGRKKILEKRMLRLKNKKDKLTQRALESQDAAEVRSINEQLAELNEEIQEVQDELDVITENERQSQMNDDLNTRNTPPTGATLVNGGITASFGQQTDVTDTRNDEDPYATMEYRRAFMKHAQTGAPIPSDLIRRDNVPANTTDLGAIIPTTILNEFINEIRTVYGQLFMKVRKLNIQGNLRVPISELQAQARWINENTVSPRQNAGEINRFVEFGCNMLEIRVAQTLLSSIITLDIFEREVVRIMVKAYMRAMDTGIVRGTGNGQMLGILNDPRVTGQAGHTIQMSAGDINNWTAWRKNFFSKLPLGYRNGEFIFPLATVDAYLETMADANNNPIFRQATGLEVNDGDNTNPNGRFFGRNITLVEPDILPDFDSASAGDVIGIFWQPEEYAINTNMAFGMRRWFDEDRNEWVNKMLTIVDGKVLNPCGYYLITKKGS